MHGMHGMRGIYMTCYRNGDFSNYTGVAGDVSEQL